LPTIKKPALTQIQKPTETVSETYYVNEPYAEDIVKTFPTKRQVERTVNKTYQVKLPVTSHVSQPYKIRVPYEVMETRYRTITRQAPVTKYRVITRDLGVHKPTPETCGAHELFLSEFLTPITETFSNVCRIGSLCLSIAKKVECVTYR